MVIGKWWSITDIEYIIVEDTDKIHLLMLIWMDTDEGMMMVWICVEEYWIGMKIIWIWIYEICGTI